jgi:hypothetical protein
VLSDLDQTLVIPRPITQPCNFEKVMRSLDIQMKQVTIYNHRMHTCVAQNLEFDDFSKKKRGPLNCQYVVTLVSALQQMQSHPTY